MKLFPLGRLLLAGGAAWAAGLLWFGVDALRPSPPVGPADGIVVLTGDADRVETAVELLDRGQGKLLLISGAGPRLSVAEVARRDHQNPAWLAARVTLGRNAVSTWGNGSEFADWSVQHHIGSALVVTSFYHMRRALLELTRAAPDVTLMAVKVPAHPRLNHGDLRKLVDDYNKYLLALIGLSRFSPGHRTA